MKNASGAWCISTWKPESRRFFHRRIGNNENGAIQVLETLIDAQKEYASTTHDDEKVKHYVAQQGVQHRREARRALLEDRRLRAAESHRAAYCRRVGRRLFPEGGRARSMATSFALLPARDRPRGRRARLTR